MPDVCLPVYDLRIGMFVSDVDCGWRNTPFPLEGVLVETAAQIEIFGGLAEYVTVDPGRSQDASLKEYMEKILGSGKYQFGYEDANTLAGITTFDDGSLAPADAFPAENRMQESRGGKAPPLSGFWANPLHQTQKWWRVLADLARARQDATAAGSPRANGPPYIPASIELVTYSEPEFTWPALPAAVDACNSAIAVLEQLTIDIAQHNDTDMPKLERAAETLALHMIAHPSAMMWAAKMHQDNNRLYKRSLEAGIYLTALGRHLGFPREPLADLAMIGILLDLGKMKLNAALLEKKGPYSDAEMQTARSHVKLGIAMLSGTGTLREPVLRAIAEHHEQVDGKGYPKGLSASNISIYGKMAAIADAYVAMVNPRAYAETMSPHNAIEQLFAGTDTRWFAPLVEQFVQSIGIFPVGSLIEMITGHIAIVVQHNPLRRLEPKILIVTHSDKRRRMPPLQIDMLKHNARQNRSRLQIRKGLPDGAHGVDVRDFYAVPQ